MPVLVLDPYLEERIRAEREGAETNYDEVWEGVLVVAPLPNNDHQVMVTRLISVLSGLTDWDRGDKLFPGVNVSDREADWMSNYRLPDVALYLAGNPAKDCGAHWMGGPDLAVEIVSPGEKPHDKLSFYASVNTREVLIVDRDPWTLEVYQLQAGKMILAGKSAAPGCRAIASAVLPLTLELQAGSPRAKIVVTHAQTGQSWKV